MPAPLDLTGRQALGELFSLDSAQIESLPWEPVPGCPGAFRKVLWQLGGFAVVLLVVGVFMVVLWLTGGSTGSLAARTRPSPKRGGCGWCGRSSPSLAPRRLRR